MEVKKIIGIDVSKNTLDLCYLSSNGSQFIQISNDAKGFREMNKWLIKTQNIRYEEAVFCMEHTGIYNVPILQFLKPKQTGIWLESAIHIKRTLGLVRGKTDKIDAERIALYAQKHIEQMQQWQPKRQVVETIKALLTLRDNLVSQTKQINAPINEFISHGDKEISKIMLKHSKNTCKGLLLDIKKIEHTIHQLIEDDEALKRIYEIITSIPGIGKVTAWLFIVCTNEFKLFSNPRSLACHCGVAPFETSSGLMKGRGRVSHLANKRLKTALHMASMTAVKFDPELKIYYDRKVVEGKSKMSVLNAIRNKLIHRMYACQKNNKLYTKKSA